LIALQLGPCLFNHWTPFNELSPEEASSPGYRHALERQHTRPDLPYGLEVWRGAKVLSVVWADDRSFEVDRFVRGSWEVDRFVRGSWEVDRFVRGSWGDEALLL
jgi:hypothetical protein